MSLARSDFPPPPQKKKKEKKTHTTGLYYLQYLAGRQFQTRLYFYGLSHTRILHVDIINYIHGGIHGPLENMAINFGFCLSSSNGSRYLQLGFLDVLARVRMLHTIFLQ